MLLNGRVELGAVQRLLKRLQEL